MLDISVIIPVRNEEANLGRCLASMSDVTEVVVVDSDSTDRTLAICAEYNATVVQFRYQGGYPKKRQWVLDNWRFASSWVLLVDADERVTDELWDEIGTVINSEGRHCAYAITKCFCFLGRPLRYGGFSHKAVSLFRVGSCRFEELTIVDCGLDMEVHERLIVSGQQGTLRNGLEHWDFRGLHHYLRKHNDYSTWDAGARKAIRDETILSIRKRFSGLQFWRRLLKWCAIRVPFEPLLWFFYHYFVRLGFLDGRRGLIASRIRSCYIADIRDKMWEAENVRSTSP
jgi:glycosyltransferase involved in cell wall biosynthesis